jgi:hypothetical protein
MPRVSSFCFITAGQLIEPEIYTLFRVVTLDCCSISEHSDPEKEICRCFFIDPSVDSILSARLKFRISFLICAAFMAA